MKIEYKAVEEELKVIERNFDVSKNEFIKRLLLDAIGDNMLGKRDVRSIFYCETNIGDLIFQEFRDCSLNL